MSEILNLSTSKIQPGNNDRKYFDAAELAELAASIQEHGLAQPITVRPSNQKFEIVAGERRFRAIAQVLGWETIPSIVREMSDEEASGIMLAENTGRKDLSPIDEANAYQTRQEKFSWSAEHISRVAGVSVDLVERRLSLLNLVSEIQLLVSFGNMPIGHAELLTKLDSNRQRIALRIFRQSNGITKAAFSNIVSDLFEEQSQENLFDLENFWVEQVSNENEPPTRGDAISRLPQRDDLPKIESNGSDTTSTIILGYIETLKENGFDNEAEVIGTLAAQLAEKNYLHISPTI